MKEKVLILGMALVLIIGALVAACSDESNVKKITTIYQLECDGSKVQVVIIDSCEYLYGPWGNATVLTHKGNCKNHKK